jgi:hypothetical protein
VRAMSQQVNLLIDDLLPKRTLFGTVHAVATVFGCVAILTAISVHTLIDISHLTGQHDRLTRQLAVLADANAKARASVTSVEDSKLAARVADLRSQLDSRTALETALAGEVKTRSRGFSGHLDGLAANALPGLWLTEIQLLDGGDRMRLSGMTIDPVLVPKFLKGLGHGDEFAGHRFDTFELAADETNALRFTITGPDEDAK